MIDIKRQNVKERCRRICAGYNESSVCRFADNSGLLGFIDTSQGQNGTRGIAFSDKGIFANFDGDTREILYKNIKSVQIISSFEDFFADELSVVFSDTHPDLYTDPNSDKEIRISDFSLDKSELKRLIDGFCADYREDDRSENDSLDNSDEFPKNVATLLRNSGKTSQNLGDLSQNSGNLPQSTKDQKYQVKTAVSESLSDKNISDDNDIAGDNISGGFGSGSFDIFDNDIPPIFRRQEDFVDIVFDDRAPVVTETILPSFGTRSRVIETRDITQIIPQPPLNNNKNIRQQNVNNSGDLYEDEAAERIRIQNMSPEETLSFLAQSLNEINSPVPKLSTEPRQPEPLIQERRPDREQYPRSVEIRDQESAPLARPQVQQQVQPPVRTQSPVQTQPNDQPQNQANQTQARGNIEPPPVREEKKPVLQNTVPLTVEPIWGDIYIKASRNLRELCESGRLSMSQIEAELDSRLLDSAKAFAEITADESKVPKVLIPKITELKAAAKNFDQYFQSGEDIAVRAMFFMMYQMLSYADRIVETPETKERLNDFFRRFGSAGITLSMLDMRV